VHHHINFYFRTENMKTAYFDTIGGVSGDMTLGAFVSAGISIDELNQALSGLQLTGFELQARHIERNGIVAVKVDVVISEQPHYHRHLKDIEELIDRGTLSAGVKECAKKIFRTVAAAEAKVHNTDIEKVHFHEVGAIDSLIDIVGAAICIEKLGIQRIYSSPVKTGSGGFVKSQHGKLPIPTPATMEILKGYPTMLTDIPFELATPTGAAIIRTLSGGMLASENITVEQIGYGAGGREIAEVPNLLRLLIGELAPEYSAEDIVSIETNIDNMNPELYPYVIEQLLAAGALDAYMIPILMKKGRPGIILSMLVERARIDALLAVLFRETTTLGVRLQPVGRKKLPREIRTRGTSLGPVNVKAVLHEGKEYLHLEFEECKRIAQEHKLPLREVYAKLEREIQRQ
jgi:pyridinium-3,5-bisthiocarboxylic acid mononucleotide nickel chelatase